MSDKIGHQNLILWAQANPVSSFLRSSAISFCNFTTAGEVLQSFRILLTFYFFAQRCCLQTVVFTFTPLFVFLRTFTDLYRPTQTKWGAKKWQAKFNEIILVSSPQMVSPDDVRIPRIPLLTQLVVKQHYFYIFTFKTGFTFLKHMNHLKVLKWRIKYMATRVSTALIETPEFLR